MDEVLAYFKLCTNAPYRFRRNLRLQLERICTVVEAGEAPAAIRDPNDAHILAAAHASNAALIISGDRDLLELEKIGNITVITPKAFLAL